jgi:hypothetical protein
VNVLTNREKNFHEKIVMFRRHCHAQGVGLSVRDARQQDSDKTPSETRDAALQPVAVVRGERLGQGLDQCPPVCPRDGDDETLNDAGHGNQTPLLDSLSLAGPGVSDLRPRCRLPDNGPGRLRLSIRRAVLEEIGNEFIVDVELDDVPKP